MGGRLVSDLRLDQATGAVNAVVSRDREDKQTVHQADAVVFAVGITGVDLARPTGFPVSCTLRSSAIMLIHLCMDLYGCYLVVKREGLQVLQLICP